LRNLHFASTAALGGIDFDLSCAHVWHLAFPRQLLWRRENASTDVLETRCRLASMLASDRLVKSGLAANRNYRSNPAVWRLLKFMFRRMPVLREK
jgi:hypothetical protein